MMVEVRNGKIYVDHSTAMGPGKTRFKSLFPFSKWRKDRWEIMATIQNIEAVNKHFGAMISVESVKEVGDEEIIRFLADVKYDFKLRPYKHQLQALIRCEMKKSFAYFLEPGLGKTKVSIDDAMILHGKGKVDSVLVVCPKSVMSVWKKEIEANVSECYVSTWPQCPPSYVGGVEWFIINIDALVVNEVEKGKIRRKLEKTESSKEENLLRERVLKLEADAWNGYSVADRFLSSSMHSMMIIDESTSIAHHDSLRTKMCMKLGNRAEYKRILTGDPIANTPLDLYSQMNWLGSEFVNDRSFFAFRNHFCDMGGYKNKQVVGYKNEEELKEMVNGCGYRVRTKDVLDMPPQVWTVRKVFPSEETKAMYDRIVEGEILTLFKDRSEVSTSTILTRIVKLQQLCGGTIIDDERAGHVVGSEKLEELRGMLPEWGESGILIWHHFREEGRMIKRGLGDRYGVGEFNGDMSGEERSEITERFEEGNINVLVIQDDSGHLGITLNRANHAVFFSNHMRPMVRMQAERRNWRIGQKSPVFYYDLLFDGMIDSWIYKRLKEKRKFNAKIIDNMSLTKDQVMEIIYDGKS